MKKRYKDLTGQKFGMLTVIEISKVKRNNDGHAYWKCVCDCGNHIVVPSNHLKGDITHSCGCINDGKSYTRLYAIWKGMRQRCYCKSSSSYQNYGERGIGVCSEWKNSFLQFKKWANETGYTDELTIERIDVNRDYSPQNCRWATIKEQANNTRRNHYLILNDEKKTIAEWSEVTGIKQNTILYRIRRGWRVEDALTKGATL